jgi:hypothetical protein
LRWRKKFVRRGTFVLLQRLRGALLDEEESRVPYYELCLIAGDGGRLRHERRLAADLDMIWGRVG